MLKFASYSKTLLRLSSLLLLSTMVCAIAPAQETPPDWARRTFSAPPDRVFDAALKSIPAQHYEIASKNEENKTVRFTVGKSAFSWGYVIDLRVSPGADNTSNVSLE